MPWYSVLIEVTGNKHEEISRALHKIDEYREIFGRS